jgi:hypothetical protein
MSAAKIMLQDTVSLVFQSLRREAFTRSTQALARRFYFLVRTNTVLYENTFLYSYTTSIQSELFYGWIITTVAVFSRASILPPIAFRLNNVPPVTYPG